MLRTMKRFGLAVLMSSAALASAAGPAHADLAVYEPFGYTPGPPLLGANGGTGFTDPWHPGGFNASIFTNYTVAADSLPYPALLTSGNHVDTAAQTAISGLTRDLATPLGAPGTTAYLSVLLRPEGTVGAGPLGGFFGLYLNASTTTPNVSQDLFLGKPGISDLYDIEDRGGTNRHFSTAAATTGATDLLVLRMDFTAGVDKFTLYVDPAAGAPEPPSGVVKQDSDVGTVGALTLYSTGAYGVDEIRIGRTYADVVPTAVPEPGSFVSVGTVALLGLGYAWRRRKARATA
jgi:hypothetical protein